MIISQPNNIVYKDASILLLPITTNKRYINKKIMASGVTTSISDQVYLTLDIIQIYARKHHNIFLNLYIAL